MIPVKNEISKQNFYGKKRITIHFPVKRKEKDFKNYGKKSLIWYFPVRNGIRKGGHYGEKRNKLAFPVVAVSDPPTASFYAYPGEYTLKYA